jgi:hypothetical protein
MDRKFRSFEDYMRVVNVWLERRCGLSSDDLPDYCYYDAYDLGDPPERAAKKALKAAKDY